MNQRDRNLAEILELAGSEKEREQLAELWRDLGSLGARETRAAPGFGAPAGADLDHLFASGGLGDGARAKRRHLLEAAALFAAGLLTGALAGYLAPADTTPGLNAAGQARATIQAALEPNRTSAERVAAVHAVESLAVADTWAQDALVRRVLRDRTPAVQLAALDVLEHVELSGTALDQLSGEIARLDSPIVQIMVLDVLRRYPSPSLEQALERLSDDKTIDPLVRRHAERALLTQKQRSTA